jgi:hypothetical protein
MIKSPFDDECLKYIGEETKLLLVHRWSDKILFSPYKFNRVLEKLELGEILGTGHKSAGVYGELLARAGISLIFTGYDNGWHELYGGCDEACCQVYDNCKVGEKAQKALDYAKQINRG